MRHAIVVSDLARLPECAAIAALKGVDSIYVADAAVRAYRHRSLSELCLALGRTCDPLSELIIRAGNGTLILSASGTTFVPASSSSHPGIRPRSGTDATRRRAHCAICDRYRGDRCTVAGCACAGLGQPEVLSSRCPLGKW